jgi:hypothetical protein
LAIEHEELKMPKLKNIAAATIVSVVLAGAIGAPAVAQPYGGFRHGYDNGPRQYQDAGSANMGRNLTSSYVDSLEWRINNAAQQGRISRFEARRLLSDLRQIQGPAIYRVENGRASGWEIRRVSNIVSRVEAETEGYGSNGRDEHRWHRGG